MNTPTGCISFSVPMILALRDGRKAQTRRTGGLDEVNKSPDEWQFRCLAGRQAVFQHRDGHHAACRCPHPVGDILWVKEPLCRSEYGYVAYRSDGRLAYRANESPELIPWPWKPARLGAMYCPRWASRDMIRITDVRAQRLQEISEEDAIAEGCKPGYILASPTVLHKGLAGYSETPMDYRGGYQSLWDRINGRGSWARNDHVFAYTFTRIQEDAR